MDNFIKAISYASFLKCPVITINSFQMPFVIDHLFTLCLAGGLEHLSELLQRFPNNVHVLLEVAKVSFQDVINHDDILFLKLSS